MIIEALYKNITVLDRVQHRALKLRRPFTDYTPTAEINAVFVTAVEFADVCREYPIVFVRAGKDDKTGEELAAPMAVLGLQQKQNLYLQPGGGWRTPYVPAVLRRYPFAMVQSSPDQLAVCFDRGYDGLSDTEGQPLFQSDGQPTETLTNLQAFLQNFEQEVQRTRGFCSRLLQLNLLQDMRFDATLPDGGKLGVDGFLTIDEKALAELPDAQVVELQRNGMLGLLHAHQISLGLMRRLVEWHVTK